MSTVIPLGSRSFQNKILVLCLHLIFLDTAVVLSYTYKRYK